MRFLEQALGDLPFRRRVFLGVPSFSASGRVFAFQWEGRLGLVFRDGTDAEVLMAAEGVTAWKPDPARASGQAVLLAPEAWEDPAFVAPWIQRAHAQATTARGFR